MCMPIRANIVMHIWVRHIICPSLLTYSLNISDNLYGVYDHGDTVIG